MPKALEENEVVAMIHEIKTKNPSANQGILMKELTPFIKGKFDGKRASELVKKALEN